MIQVGCSRWGLLEALDKAKELSKDNPLQRLEVHDDMGMRYIVVGDTGAEGLATLCYVVTDGAVKVRWERVL